MFNGILIMDTGTWVGIIGIVVTVFGLFLAKKVIKNRKSQSNKIIIKSKGIVHSAI